MLITVAIILGILWLLGVLVHVGGGLIYLILLIALVIFAYDLVTDRRRV